MFLLSIVFRMCTTRVRIMVRPIIGRLLYNISQKFTAHVTVIVLAVVQLLQTKMRQTRRAVSRPLLAVLLLRARKPIETAGENTCSQERASFLGNSRGEREARRDGSRGGSLGANEPPFSRIYWFLLLLPASLTLSACVPILFGYSINSV